jgi:kojibiose phosphorylase
MWREAAGTLATGFDPATGLFEQFEGYFRLADVSLADYADRTVPIDLVLGREAVQRSQVIKQADVVMALHVLWDRLPPEVRAANFRRYEPRTAHGSSLSPAIHAIVAAGLGDLELAQRYFWQAAEIDLANNMGNASAGVHMAALGGLWQAMVTGFAGIRANARGIRVNPRLPEHWSSLCCAVHWRGRRVRVEIRRSPALVRVEVQGTGSVPVQVGDGEAAEVEADTSRAFAWATRCGGVAT